MLQISSKFPSFKILLGINLLFFSCTSNDPEGKYVGEVKDWIQTGSRWLDSIVCRGQLSGIPVGKVDIS